MKTAFAAFLIAVCVFVTLRDDSDAMQACQVKHSYDTCFHTLNR